MNKNKLSPLVSIILPSYNHELFIETCIKSVVAQTYQNIEVIIIDDGSKDRTPEIVSQLLAELNDSRVQFIAQENMGPSQTINKAVRLSSGELVTILNTDDAYYENRIEELVNAWTTTKADFIFTKVKHVDQNGSPLHSTHPHKKWYDKSLMNLFLEPSVGFALLKDNSAVTTGNFFFTRALFDNLNGFSEKRVAHDLDFILRATLLTEPHFINSELMIYRVHGNNDIIRSAHLIKPEIESIISNFFFLQFSTQVQNPLAPAESNWPLFFMSYIKRNHLENIYRKSFSKFLSSSLPGNASLLNSKSDKSQLTSSKKEIGLVSHELSLTGAPALVYELAVQLRKKGFAPKVFSPKLGPLLDTINANNIPFERIRFSDWIEKRTYFRKLIAFFLCVFSNLFSLKGTIVVNSIANWPLLIPLYVSPSVKKIFFYIHEDFSPDSFIENRLARKLIKKILLSDKVDLWFGSDYTRKIWADLGFNGKVQYFSGFDSIPAPSIQEQVEKRPIKFLFVGTFSARKGLPYLVSVFENISKTTSVKFELNIVGVDDRYMDDFTIDLCKNIYTYNLTNENKIKLYPQLNPNELDSFYTEADIYITTSLSECLPLAILNAMRHGLPVITTDVGGCAEAIQDSINGFVVPPRDFNRLKSAVLYYCENPDKIKAMGKDASNRFKEKFDNNSVISSFTDILEHV